MNIKEILTQHSLWANGDPKGKRANLRRADLRRADLRRADLRGADLSEANLWGANLWGADLRGANLWGADLRGADLSEADLWRADLSEANLSEANLWGANLSEANLSEANLWGADLRGADLSGADLSGADLRGANLRGADLRGADLRGANLWGANLRGADLIGAKNVNYPITCPEKGSFTAFKKVENDYIVELLIPEDAKRCSATTRKCRCDKAIVVSITTINGEDAGVTSVASKYDCNFLYDLGQTVTVPNFDEDRWNECSSGIHFFITRQEAVDYSL